MVIQDSENIQELESEAMVIQDDIQDDIQEWCPISSTFDWT